MASPLVVNVAELLRRPGSRRELRVAVCAEGLQARDAAVPDGAEIDVDLVLESLSDGITVNGHLRAPWRGDCRRCLGPATGVLEAAVAELYQVHPQTDEAFGFDGDQLDLRPLVRELVLVELPLAPLCRDGCRGLCPECGADRNVEDCGHSAEAVDLRWGALDVLRGRLEEPG